MLDRRNSFANTTKASWRTATTETISPPVDDKADDDASADEPVDETTPAAALAA